ncbi:hypothetical protein H0V99_01695 [Candidatus Saccharibacteria bacterium]|nr:hypothetical protein [Candidatus Saccharibacteria bacterium]
MTHIKNFDDINQTLTKYVPLSKEITGKNITLDRMRPMMEALGNPQRRLKIVHIAGTSGKTSTSYYIAALLTQAGKKTGLTVSPHVDSVAERIQINLKSLEEKEFATSLVEFLEILEQSSIKPTYFELIVAFAYWYFVKAGVDYAVIETGLGGMQDGTNVADNSDKVCVITDIGFDHMNILGHTLEEISRQKAGIIHTNNSAIMYRQSEVVTDIIEDWCKEHQSTLKLLEEKILQADAPVALQVLPSFQQRNWLLAYEAYKLLKARDTLPELSSEKLDESMQIRIPGRMEEQIIGSKKIIMDGAHNEQKIKTFVSSFKTKYPHTTLPVLLSLKQDKEFAGVLPLLKPITSRIIITEFTATQDLPAKAIDAHELAKAAKIFGYQDISVQEDQDKAYRELLACPGNMALVIGSFYLLGQLRHNHTELIS